jgi:hypothetical protein
MYGQRKDMRDGLTEEEARRIEGQIEGMKEGWIELWKEGRIEGCVLDYVKPMS